MEGKKDLSQARSYRLISLLLSRDFLSLLNAILSGLFVSHDSLQLRCQQLLQSLSHIQNFDYCLKISILGDDKCLINFIDDLICTLIDRISVSRLIQISGSAFSPKFQFVQIFQRIEHVYLDCGFIHQNGSKLPDYQIGGKHSIVG